MKKKIMVDMDDVICGGGFMGIINEFLGTNYTETDVPGYYVQDLIPKEKLNDFFDYFLSKNMYDYCQLEPGAVENLFELNDFFDIFIGTSYLIPKIEERSGIVLLHKFNYLREHLPFINPRNIAFICNKDIIQCYAKIDDRIENLKRARRKLLYSSYHNVYLEDVFLEKKGIERACGWPDVKKKLLKR